MPRKQGSIGKTKLRMLAIIYHLEKKSRQPYGYAIWQLLKQVFKSYSKPTDIRNVYHHLQDLMKLRYIERKAVQPTKGAPNRHIYTLTEKGRKIAAKKYEEHMETLERTN